MRGSCTSVSEASICGSSTFSPFAPGLSSTADAGARRWTRPASSCRSATSRHSRASRRLSCSAWCGHAGESRTRSRPSTMRSRWPRQPKGFRVATEDAFELALRQRVGWPIGELACWRWRAGLDDEAPDGAAEPYAVQIAGDWSRAAELWTEISCPYEAALALADADDDGALRRALDELQRLGAQPAAEIVAGRLRERGARGVAT